MEKSKSKDDMALMNSKINNVPEDSQRSSRFNDQEGDGQNQQNKELKFPALNMNALFNTYTLSSSAILSPGPLSPGDVDLQQQTNRAWLSNRTQNAFQEY